MKYITYEHFDGYQAFVIFDKITNHCDIAKALRQKKILGAGFVDFSDDRAAYCYGESISMKIQSRATEDSKLINRECGVI